MAKFEVVNGVLVRVGAPASAEEIARVERNRRELAATTIEKPAESLEAPPADFVGTAEDWAQFKRTVRRRVNGKLVTEEEFRVSRETKRELLDANMKEIIKAKKFPGIAGDDTTFNNAVRYDDLTKRFGEKKVKRMMAAARKAGVPVGPGWGYSPELASGANAPDGWVPPTQTRGEFKKRIRKAGLVCEDMGVKSREPETDPHERKYLLAPDLVKEMVVKELKADPDLLARAAEKPKKKVAELKEKVIHKYGAKKK